jgi:RNA polymerase sigma factor (TIGR02999 family)
MAKPTYAPTLEPSAVTGDWPSMGDADQHVVNRLLHEMRAGNSEAFAQLLPLVYDELHHIAGRQRRKWDGEETLDTTGLVHEAYIRLVDHSGQQWESYPHFLAVAATAMRQILVDYAKRKHAVKRGGGLKRVPMVEIESAFDRSGPIDEARSAALIALDDSLRRLADIDFRQSRIVECRFFGEMTIEETATALGIAPITVRRGWTMAKSWLFQDLTKNLEEAT